MKCSLQRQLRCLRPQIGRASLGHTSLARVGTGSPWHAWHSHTCFAESPEGNLHLRGMPALCCCLFYYSIIPIHILAIVNSLASLCYGALMSMAHCMCLSCTCDGSMCEIMSRRCHMAQYLPFIHTGSRSIEHSIDATPCFRYVVSSLSLLSTLAYAVTQVHMCEACSDV
jgi:hypothetical protein